MTIQVNVYDAKTQLSKLLELAASGERVIIAKNGKPVADLVRHQGKTVRFGTLAGKIVYDDADFEHVDPEITAMFYGDEAASDSHAAS